MPALLKNPGHHKQSSDCTYFGTAPKTLQTRTPTGTHTSVLTLAPSTLVKCQKQDNNPLTWTGKQNVVCLQERTVFSQEKEGRFHICYMADEP